MVFDIPKSLKFEHEYLYEKLTKATKEGGKTGEAAKAVVKILYPHFMKEEEYALPPLGILPSLAEDRVSSDMMSILRLTDKLKSEIHHLFEEHKAIVSELNNLIDAAKQEQKMEYVHFAEKLKMHAQIEEEVLYPTAMLIGDLLVAKLLK